MIDSQTSVYGLLGYPIKHSFSPQIHNFIFHKLSYNSIYLCFEVGANQLKNALSGIRALDYKGLNVTIPYKERVMPYLDKIDENASIIGAVNTIRITGKRLYGFNTDGEGFILSLKQHNFDPKNKNIMILGAGGAARALSVYLAREKVKTITYYDIKLSRAAKLAKRIRNFFPAVTTSVLRNNKESLYNSDLLINATGMGLRFSDPLPLELNNFSKNLVVYDLIYNPLFSKFLKKARSKGLKVINGLWMLIYQAIKSQEIWQQKSLKISAQKTYNYLAKSFINK